MTITVFGAGAIGGITGAALARAGHDVLLVDKAEDHVAAINTGGLTIEGRDGAYTVRVLAGLIHKIGLISPEQADDLTRAGLAARVLPPQHPDDGYRVVLGPYATREQAEATGRRLGRPFWIYQPGQ